MGSALIDIGIDADVKIGIRDCVDTAGQFGIRTLVLGRARLLNPSICASRARAQRVQ